MNETRLFQRRRLLLAGAYALAGPLFAPAVKASDDAAPIRLIVPFPPGGTTDFMARFISEKIQQLSGLRLVVENKGGAGGMIGTEMVARAPADGRTLLLASSAQLALDPFLFREVRYDSIRDFSPITLIGATPNVLLAHPSLPVKTLQDVITLARAKPGALSFASPGRGSTAGLGMELMQAKTGIHLIQVPYRGAGPAINDVVGGQVPLIAVAITSVVGLAKSGKLRAIALTGAHRSAVLPEVPTFGETIPGFEASGWYGIVAPAGTPAKVIGRLNKVLHDAIDSKEVQDAFSERGIDVLSDSPAEFAGYIKSELGRWGEVIKNSGAAPH